MTAKKHPDPSTWWKHRRRHSYISLTALIGIMTYAVVGDVSQAQAELLGTLGWALAGVIGAYVACATWDDVAKSR